VWHPAYIGDEIPNAESIAAQEAFRKSMAEHMAASPVKEVYLFVHGYNNTFSDSVITVAQMWHFLGRAGVPVAYSWPAGASGLLRGYTRDSESSEFTVFHLKQCLRMIASCPEVEKINILAHSRGTAVTMSALRELHLEIAGSGRSTREVLKLGTLVLAAPDLDVDTVIQRMVTVRLGRVPERFALYVNKSDKALSMSNWLFEGITRLGALDSKMFTPEELAYARNEKNVQIIEARVSDTGAFGHDYFHSNPAVSSDIILLMRYAYPPGADSGRPLRINPNGFWYIDDEYPGPPKTSLLGPATQPKAP
jgi:esterase/lipase superfamily enzyme